MKDFGRIASGSYKGQFYAYVRKSTFPHWVVVVLLDGSGNKVTREVREECLGK